MKKTLPAVLIPLLVLLAFLSLGIGPASIGWKETFSALTGLNNNANQSYIILSLRLPRILGAILCGAILGVSGAVFQAVLKNPMADPFILGISSGASFGVALALSLGFGSIFGLPFPALVGALGTTLAIFFFSTRNGSSNTTLLLTGVSANYILSAAMTLLLFLNKEQYQRILFWTLGSFSSTTYNQVLISFISFILLFALLSLGSNKLDLLLLDEASALSLGLAVKRTKLLYLIISSLAVAICVSFFGVIGFIGLMAPHIIRLLVGPKHATLLLPSALLGAFLLLFSDTLSRMLLHSGEMPVGVVTSLIGAPLFIFLLRKGGYSYA